MALAFILIIFKGSSDSQRSVLGNFLTRYIDETAAAVVTAPSQNQLADINSLVAYAASEKAPLPSIFILKKTGGALRLWQGKMKFLQN